MHRYSSYILFLLTSVLVVILYVNGFGPLQSLQQSTNDMLIGMTAPSGERPNLVMVNIDQRAQDQFGEWPWNRDLLADLLAATAGGEPNTMLVDIELGEDAYQDSAGYTAILAGQLSWMKNVVLRYDIALSTYRVNKTNNPDHLFDWSVTVDNPLGVLDEHATLQVRKVFLPAEKLLASGPYLGFDYTMPDDDRVLRHQPLVMNYEGYYYPSLSLVAAAAWLGVPADQIVVTQGQSVKVGSKRTIPINGAGEFYVTHYPSQAFSQISAADVLSDGFDLAKLRDKLVLVSVNDPAFCERFDSPAAEATPESVARAGTIDNIINDHLVTVPQGRSGTVMIILFAVGAACAFLLPRLAAAHRAFALIGALLLLAGLNFVMVNSMKTAPQTIYIALELVLFIAASFMLESKLVAGEKAPSAIKTSAQTEKKARKRTAADESGKVPVREIPGGDTGLMNAATEAVLSSSQRTAMEKPAEQAPFDHATISLDDEPVVGESGEAQAGRPEIIAPSGRGAGPEIVKPRTVSADEPLGDSDAQRLLDDIRRSEAESAAQAAASQEGDKKTSSGQVLSPEDVKSFGRYQVTGVLGRGAMGMVYSGTDPAINRKVALKTIRLDFVTDPEEEAELRERLHREAQAAGKLSHPNIVTIYDVGSEGHLQYIAMEFIEGQTLEEMFRRKARFNYKIMAQIIMQICSALEYAHEQGIVHRDIKPANIMIMKDYRVKVMDYGIARVDSNSMTKTGIAMGTPNYISPEQLRGKNIDHRADLFSLGVVMYELLLGRRPFKGENITSLIYSILNHEPEKPSNVDPQIPLLLDHVIGRALQKDPNKRYQRASEIMADLTDLVEAFSTS